MEGGREAGTHVATTRLHCFPRTPPFPAPGPSPHPWGSRYPVSFHPSDPNPGLRNLCLLPSKCTFSGGAPRPLTLGFRVLSFTRLKPVSRAEPLASPGRSSSPYGSKAPADTTARCPCCAFQVHCPNCPTEDPSLWGQASLPRFSLHEGGSWGQSPTW